MDRRTTFALLIVLVVVLIAAGVVQGWFVQGASRIVGHPLVAPAATDTPSVQNLWSFDSSKVQVLEISDLQQAKNVVLQRQKDGSWRITAPQDQPADTGTVEEAAAEVSSLSIVTNLGMGLDASIFGIDKPHYELTLKTSSQNYILEIGAATPTGSGYYVREKGDSRILIVDQASLNSVIAFLNQLPLMATATPAPSPMPVASSTPGVSPTAP
ncbi:MAG: DUF4340 domain-containing protein [Anaerolineales bacterium]|jgi:hypothetical protein